MKYLLKHLMWGKLLDREKTVLRGLDSLARQKAASRSNPQSKILKRQRDKVIKQGAG